MAVDSSNPWAAEAAAAGIPVQDKLSASELAESYGWAAAVLNSTPELKALFQKATAGPWSPDRFAASLRNTKWYQKHSESWRQAETLRLTDPKTYDANLNATKARIKAEAAAMGAVLSEEQLTWRATQAFKLGWSDIEITQVLGGYVKAKNGVMQGKAAEDAQALREIAFRNGVRYNDQWFTNAAAAVAKGTATVESWEQQIRKQAASAFPVFAEQIKAGQNVSDIAEPYRQTMGALLELNPAEVDLFDPTIRKALASRNPTTGAPSARSLWEFENDLRKDKRWLSTNNARESLTSVADGVLRAWGFNG